MTMINKLLTKNHIVVRRFYSSDNKKSAYYHRIGKEALVYRTLGQQLDVAAEKYPNKDAVISCHEGKRHTFETLKGEVDRLAAGFLRLGLKIGDPVCVWAPNNMMWSITMFAAAKAGLVTVGINPGFQGPEVEYCLQKVGVKAIVAPATFKTQNYYSILESLCPELKDAKPGDIKSSRLPHLKTVIIDSDKKFKGAFNLVDILNMGDTSDAISKVQNLQQFFSPDSPCNIQFTSGSTGLPKATVLSHFGIVNNGIHIAARNELFDKRICTAVPLFHAFGITGTIASAVSTGAALVLPAASFDPEKSLQAIVSEKCSVIHGTPTMYVDIIRKQQELQLPINTMEIAVIGGAPITPKLTKDIEEVLKMKHVRPVYGLTEATAAILQTHPNDTKEKILNYVGQVVEHLEVKIIDINGNTVPFGEPGELCVRGYGNMLEYFNDEKSTKNTLGSDRWLKTGDQFILFENGYGKFVGRIKEMVIRGGENIFPKEIEDFLNTHPNVLETHVIGVDDERMGEEICAFIRLKDHSEKLLKSDIDEFCRGKIAHFKIPRYLEIVKDLPKTTSGKVQKFKLKELFNNKNAVQ